ncbi:30S ribosomal protein S8 [Candidatus Gromoviella agglomerans]|uniref:30S ribosomal protein S8 n=1 Tax=Candidatus Gromoviella agglomerans TaxID=2806609 RepID=UPI001E61FD64|nr:30S ribosomal protein S8 [Candidatus Gromoviella agglomerans]UFX98573.1 30S ribosomal protein S8 [Candidatus Gromoviella agglomerans]
MDIVADMLTRIRNACIARHKTVDVIFSKLNRNILDVMRKQGYIADYSFIKSGVREMLRVQLRYFEKNPVISIIKKVSLPGCRMYAGCRSLFDDRRGLYILSTSKGVMSQFEAFYDHKVGGEVLCYVF